MIGANQNPGAALRVLIIGGTRFVGPPLVRELLRAGHQVTVFNRGTSEGEVPPGVRRLCGDRVHLSRYTAEFGALAPDVVIDMVAYTQSEAEELVRVFAGVAGRLVVISSCDVYQVRDRLWGLNPGPVEPSPLTEDAPLRTRMFPYRTTEDRPKYHYEKILVERAVMGQDLSPATVLRLPAVYGPGDFQHRAFEYLKRMDDGRRVILGGEKQLRWRWSRGYVDNVAAAIALAATRPAAAGRIYNVAEEPALSTADWIGRIGRGAEWNGRVQGLPEDDLPEHLRSAGMDWRHDWVVDTTRIRRELGYVESVGPDEALSRTVRWERAHPPVANPADFDYQAEDDALARVGARGGFHSERR
jgi:nucleoside-diphosphate-sugar epimerase